MSVGLLAAVFVPSAQAQRGFAGSRGFGGGVGMHGPFRGGGLHVHGPFLGGGRGRFFRPRFGGRYFNRSGFLGLPYFYYPFPPDFYADYYYRPPVTEARPPQVVVVKTSEPAAPSPPSPPVEPLVLELRGNHWVRITDSGEVEIGPATARAASAQTSSPRTAKAEAAPPVRPVPPTVLVFRDGRQEQTTRYAIIGPVIYTNKSYYIGGAWTRKIPIAELDLPATLRLNRERGVKFNLPTIPNEVVIRP
ncbi:MAG: hypothetical protein M1404_02250 [Acidobacteria bacterium]|nr:hypothetical protein [Acidobacteriota bacterium]